MLDTVTVTPPPAGDLVLTGAGAHASLEGSTVRGAVTVRTLDASSCVLDGTVTVEHRQVGCVRFSYVAARLAHPAAPSLRARRPRRDDPDAGLRLRGSRPPRRTPRSTASCSPLIAAGGEDESEMGVHHHLRRPLRLRAAERQLDPYLPVGSQLGLFGGGHAR